MLTEELRFTICELPSYIYNFYTFFFAHIHYLRGVDMVWLCAEGFVNLVANVVRIVFVTINNVIEAKSLIFLQMLRAISELVKVFIELLQIIFVFKNPYQAASLSTPNLTQSKMLLKIKMCNM